MDAVISRAQSLRGTVRVPPDKAITHRALLLSAVALGRTEIAPWSSAEDCEATLSVIRGLGVAARLDAACLRVEGVGLSGLRAPTGELRCGDSGTTMRLSAGVLAGQPFSSVLAAGRSLSRRPMQRIAEPLNRMGAEVRGRGDGRSPELFPPLAIRGKRPLTAITYAPMVASAQVKSAVLLAGLFADGSTAVVEPAASRDHTERLLAHCGVSLQRDGLTVSIEPATNLRTPGRFAIPGDVSSAAFLLAAGACIPGSSLEVCEVGLNPTRTRILDVLRRMGAAIEVQAAHDAWEPRGAIRVTARPLQAVTINAEDVPALIDEIPVLMAVACCATGTSRFQGLRELRVKETDRIRSMTQALKRMGAVVRVSADDDLEIDGGPLTGARVDSEGDHRTAMALAVAGLAAEGETQIADATCVRKSFPDFFDLLRTLAGSAAVAVREAGA